MVDSKDGTGDEDEEQTIEDQLLRAAKKAEKLEQAAKLDEPPAQLAKAGFTPELTDQLGKALLAMKMELKNSGVTSYSFKIKRDSDKITLNVVNKKF